MNLLRSLVDDAQRIQENVREDTLQIGLAMEHLASMRQAHQAAKESYEAAEAEFVFDLSFSDEFAKARNAEAREVIRDRALVVARQTGALAYSWRVLNQCKTALENAQLAYDQAEARFKAIRVVAELMTAQLIALSADAKFLHA